MVKATESPVTNDLEPYPLNSCQNWSTRKLNLVVNLEVNLYYWFSVVTAWESTVTSGYDLEPFPLEPMSKFKVATTQLFTTFQWEPVQVSWTAIVGEEVI
jgi:hypothetical protein